MNTQYLTLAKNARAEAEKHDHDAGLELKWGTRIEADRHLARAAAKRIDARNYEQAFTNEKI